LRKGNWQVSVALHRPANSETHEILGVWPGLHEGGLYGLAIDLGSTTIAAHLCDLGDGRVLASAGIMNPQIRFGEDLMSRVSYVMMNPGGDREMTQAVRSAISDLIAKGLAEEAGIDPALIFEFVIVCNPVMHHLLLGIDPVELGQAPFALATADSVTTGAQDLDLAGVAPTARVYLLPCIAGHVGADAAAVALSEAPGAQTDLTLVVDVGTNAEILLGDTSGVLACSSPTGPAFEGAQISAGQRAAPGAIERVEIDPATKEPRFKVIGSDLWSTDPGFAEATKGTGITGICGSGIIEVVAEMRMAGLLDASGLIGGPEATGSPRCEPTGRTFAYLLHDGSADGGPRIQVTQGDIRAIQLAKSALYAGARLLMDKRGADRVDRVGAGRGLWRPYQPETRDGARHDPRRAPRQGHECGQRRRPRRAHGAVQPRYARRDRADRASHRKDRNRRRAPVSGAFRECERDPARRRSLPRTGEDRATSRRRFRRVRRSARRWRRTTQAPTRLTLKAAGQCGFLRLVS
jgi:uncharacterized 2Fe-2S/4Fe-4S cluster protein (DUF4445 family)